MQVMLEELSWPSSQALPILSEAGIEGEKIVKTDMKVHLPDDASEDRMMKDSIDDVMRDEEGQCVARDES